MRWCRNNFLWYKKQKDQEIVEEWNLLGEETRRVVKDVKSNLTSGNSLTDITTGYSNHYILLNINLVYLQNEPTCNSAMKRKKQFEYLRNCSKRKLGTKDRALYLAVEMWLLQYRVGCNWFTKMMRCSVAASSTASVTTEFVSTSSSANRLGNNKNIN